MEQFGSSSLKLRAPFSWAFGTLSMRKASAPGNLVSNGSWIPFARKGGSVCRSRLVLCQRSVKLERLTDGCEVLKTLYQPQSSPDSIQSLLWGFQATQQKRLWVAPAALATKTRSDTSPGASFRTGDSASRPDFLSVFRGEGPAKSGNWNPEKMIARELSQMTSSVSVQSLKT